LRRRAYVRAVLAITPLLVGAWWYTRISSDLERIAAAPRQSTVDPQNKADETGVVSRPLARTTVRVDVNPASVDTSSRGEAAKVCRLEVTEGPEPWTRWADLSGPRLLAISSSAEVPVYAVRIPSGVVLLAVNHGEAIAALRVGIKTGKGIFRVERHGFSVAGDGPVRTERLQTVMQKGPGTLSKPAWLAPKSAMLYRVVDETRELGKALSNGRNALRAITDSSSRVFRLIRAPFSESGQRIERIAAQGGAMPRGRLVQLLERAGVSLAHAQTLFRNCRSSGSLSGEDADRLGAALDRLEASLDEVMAGAYSLVPNVEWGQPPPGEPLRTPLNVQLSNRGSSTLRLVKMGLVVPEDTRVSPEDQALFRAVKPSETVRATFMITPASAQDLTAVRAHISYLAGRAPSHIRIKAD
jgi:hypothetical protein